MSLGQAPLALLVPALAARAKDQRLAAAVLLGLTVLTFCGLVFGPTGLILPFGVLLGGGVGGLFGLGLTLIVLRARDTAGAADLAAMSQSVGYTLASLGPLGFGLAHDLTGGWGASVALFCLIAAAAWLCSLGAGRNRTVGVR
jgi:CP family cyanate transporter-like MFS transporter